jgi:outer membrane receptor for Fe3+-dicitrate
MRPTLRGLALALAATLLSLLPASAHAQATLQLRVVNESRAAVADAEVAVRLGRSQSKVRTDSGGVARLVGLRAGLAEVTVRRLGYAAATVDVRLGDGENGYTVQLTGTHATLDSVRVVASAPVAARHDDFERRRLRGTASSVITGDEIMKRDPVRLSQMLRRVPGVRVADSLGSIVLVSTRGAKPSRNTNGANFGLVDCVLRLMVDGVLMPPLSNLDAVLPRDVYGVEVYNGVSRMPPELGGMRTDAWCGLVAVWTR